MVAGGRHAAELHRALLARGHRAHYDAVRRFLRRRLGSSGRPAVAPAPPVPSARPLSFDFVRCPAKRTAEEQGRLNRLAAALPVLPQGLTSAGAFAAMIRRQSPLPLSAWLAQVERSGVGEVRTCAAGLRQDEAAVQAALTERWSNGPVEGHVHWLKLIKRQMYGRAGCRLLRARVWYMT